MPPLVSLLKLSSFTGLCLAGVAMLTQLVFWTLESEYKKAAILCAALTLPGLIYCLWTGDQLYFDCQTDGKPDICFTKPAATTEAK